MTTLLLVRHGMNDQVGKAMPGRSPGVSLNDEGRAQAESMATWLSKLPISAIYSSPMERAQETAAPLAKSLGLTVQTCPDLNEVEFGKWTGSTLGELDGDPLWHEFNRRRSEVRPPGGESMQEVQARMLRAIAAIRTAWPDGTVVAFSHGDPIRLAVMAWLGMEIDSIHRFNVDTACASAAEMEGDWSRVLYVNRCG